MRHFLAVVGIIFAACVSITVIGRVMAQLNSTTNAFIQQLMSDSRAVDAQWTWRDVYPGRDTMQYTINRLENAEQAGFFAKISITLYQARIEWTTTTSPVWNGAILSDNDLPPPHVYAIVIRPPPDHLKLGDVMLTYGTPLSGPTQFGNTRGLCFAQGVCISINATRHARLRLNDVVLSLSYLPTRVIRRSLADIGWQGLRRY